MITRCSSCDAQRSITIEAQREALTKLNACKVAVFYAGSGLYRLTYGNQRKDRSPMIAYLTARDMVEEAAKLHEEFLRKRRRKRKNNDN